MLINQGKHDLLNREDFVSQLVKLIDAISEDKHSSTICIDGKWGSGKSFTIDMLASTIEHIQQAATADYRYLIFNYNCWIYDYYDEPLIAIISAMKNIVDEEISLFSKDTDAKIAKAWHMASSGIASIGSQLAKNKVGIDIYKTVKDVKDSSNSHKTISDSLFYFQENINYVKQELKKIASEKLYYLLLMN